MSVSAGNMDLDLYAEDCYFADDFAGFYGRSRFKSNLDNLTAFIVDSDVKLLSLQPEGVNCMCCVLRNMAKVMGPLCRTE